MTDKERWIREVAQEIGCTITSVRQAVKNIGAEIKSKYDVVLCYAQWSVPKLKDIDKQEAAYKRRINYLEQLLRDVTSSTDKMKDEYNEQMQRKNQLLDTQNEIIADRDRKIAEMQELLRGLPKASGE
ncbi:hypothetical protein [Lyngbya sp. PCC 8106]|uniref:hypothetical protein n=1 Tax=Lyngbya sp. (strain PCC 8106) TaxID=313612 RepID=UPI0000EAAA25|nr:hypothetical protein [Lyngbya sp. PCC 8106]EAW37419.1 hypothetical protein L8106_00290 [Lyngbya sp. PCC 8106]